MIKKPITYKAKQFDADDNVVDVVRTENFYFNLTQAEALEINLMEDLEQVGQSKDPKAIIPVFKRIIHYSYGVRLPSGKFTKDPAETTDFLSSDAYSELFLGLLQNGEQGVVEFVRAVCDFQPAELENKVEGVAQAARPQPQDHKPKESTVSAAENKRVTENTTVQAPAEAKRVEPSYAVDHGNTPGQVQQGDYRNDPEYQQFLAEKAQREQMKDGQNVAPSPAVELIAESPIERPAFESQSLRRDARED